MPNVPSAAPGPENVPRLRRDLLPRRRRPGRCRLLLGQVLGAGTQAQAAREGEAAAMTVDQGRTALYRLYDESGGLLYVGITSNPEARFAKHKADKRWWPCVARKDVEWYDKRANALAAEELAIKVKDPRFNREHSRRRPAAKVTVELTAAHMAGLDMLKRVTCSRVPGGDRYTYGDLLLILLDRELAARGLYGNGRCLHAWVT